MAHFGMDFQIQPPETRRNLTEVENAQKALKWIFISTFFKQQMSPYTRLGGGGVA